MQVARDETGWGVSLAGGSEERDAVNSERKEFRRRRVSLSYVGAAVVVAAAVVVVVVYIDLELSGVVEEVRQPRLVNAVKSVIVLALRGMLEFAVVGV
jgi:hypothetical protein